MCGLSIKTMATPHEARAVLDKAMSNPSAPADPGASEEDASEGVILAGLEDTT